MAEVAEVKKKILIPETSEKHLKELAGRIRPIVSRDGVLRYVSFKNPLLRGCYGSNPELFWHKTLLHVDLGEKVVGLIPCGEIKTYHRFMHRASFTPTSAEVFAQIPEDYVSKVVAFQILGSEESGVVQEQEALEDNYHTAITRLFMKAG